MRQEVVLEEEVQQQVELFEASPQEAKAGRVGLSQNLRSIRELRLKCICKAQLRVA